MAFKHYVLTKFNLGLYSNPDKRIKIKPDVWMEHRFQLFEKYTLPSMVNQSCQNFSWLLLIDKQTPKRFIDRIENFGYSNIKICYKDWRITTCKHHDFDILTTRIDNDDAFHTDFIKKIQCEYIKQIDSKPFVISFLSGYLMDLKSNKIILRNWNTNNCPTLVTSGKQGVFKSVRSDHTKLRTKYKTFHIQRFEPYWLLTIHSQNLCNDKMLRKYLSASKKKKKKKMRKISDSILQEFGILKSKDMICG